MLLCTFSALDNGLLDFRRTKSLRTKGLSVGFKAPRRVLMRQRSARKALNDDQAELIPSETMRSGPSWVLAPAHFATMFAGPNIVAGGFWQQVRDKWLCR